MPGRIWLDVEDMFEYAAFNRRPTGIQRVQLEICRALAALDPAGERVVFVRHDPPRKSFRPARWEQVEALFDGTAPPAGGPGLPAATRLAREQPGIVGRALFRLPARLRQPLVQSIVQQRAALRSFGAFLAAAARREPGAAAAGRRVGVGPSATSGVDFETEARPGDVMLMLGAIWFLPGYAALIRERCLARGMRLSVMIYDAIPLVRREWCEPGHSRNFGAWLHSVIGLADPVVTISQASARDIERYARDQGLALRRAVAVVRLGTGFESPPARLTDGARALPPPGSYALTVSTVEARKNHALLFRVWRRMRDEMAADEVPSLVIAGRVGWMVADLMQQMRNCNFLDGKIVLIEDATDSELELLYRGCLFTVFPSFYEGWGLPVTESLAFGKPCIISNATSLPEAGGELARYFDPDDATEAYRVIRETLADRPGLARWEAEIARSFRPVPWRETAEALLACLEPAATPCPDNQDRQ